MKITLGRNVSIFKGKMDIKYMRLKCNHGTTCHMVGLAKNAVDRKFTCDILPQKSGQTESSGVKKNPSALRSNVTVKPRAMCWVTFSGCRNITRRSEHGRFVKATCNKFLPLLQDSRLFEKMCHRALRG
jgi:hypothetical protein